MNTIWVVNYTDDRFADDIGSRVFSTEAEATAWAEEYVGDQVDVEGDDRYLFAFVEKHDVLDTASSPA